MTKHVRVLIEMDVDDLPDGSTDYDYGNDVLKNVRESGLTLDDLGHQVEVSDV